MHRRTALERVHAAAETIKMTQEKALHGVFAWVKKLLVAQQMRALAFVEHVCFDETALKVRLQMAGEKDSVTGKVFVIEQRWAMLLQSVSTVSMQEATTTGSQILQGGLSPTVLGAGNAAGETIEKAEKLLMDSRAALPGDGHWLRLESICLLHKVHSAAQKTWPLHTPTISGLVHTCKVLSDGGQFKRFKDTFPALVSVRLQILHRPPRDDAARVFKEQCLQFFTPPSQQSRRRSMVLLACKFFSGDWRKVDRIQHVCTGSSCCTSRAESERKAVLHPLGIGNGVGKQGRGNQPPYRRYGPDTEIQYRLRKPHGVAKSSRILSKREADTEFQCRPHMVDTDIDCGRHFCGRHPDPPTAFLEKSKGNTEKCKGFFLRNPQNPWKRKEKRTKKQGKSENEKSKEIEKNARIGGSGHFRDFYTAEPSERPRRAL